MEATQFQGKSHGGAPEGKSPERQGLTLARDRSRAGDWTGVMINSAACYHCDRMAAGARGKGGKPNRNSVELACSTRLLYLLLPGAEDRAVWTRLAARQTDQPHVSKLGECLSVNPLHSTANRDSRRRNMYCQPFNSDMLASDPLSQLIYQLLAAHLVVLQLLQAVQHIL